MSDVAIPGGALPAGALPEGAIPLSTTTTGGTTTTGYPTWLQIPTQIISASVNTIRQNDTAPVRTVYLVDASGRPIDLTGATVVYNLYVPGTPTPVVSKAATVLAALAGMVGYYWQAGDTATVGAYNEEWVVTSADGTQTLTFPESGVSQMVIKAHGVA